MTDLPAETPNHPSTDNPQSQETAPQWTRAFPLDSVPIGGSRVFKRSGKQLAVFRLKADGVSAIDNRCPHEGYPLAQGHLSDNRLICPWHNYEFDLPSRNCLFGEEGVRAYPTRVTDGVIEVDLADPQSQSVIPALLESLDQGLLEDRMGQVARDVLRLLDSGVSAVELVRRPRFSWTQISYEYDVQGGRDEREEECKQEGYAGAYAGSPEGDRRKRRRRLVAGAALERRT